MRILHTSDWHLGHTLHGVSREFEHRRFLEWLLATLSRERIDALLLAGDVFDTANPGSAAQQNYYGFLAQAHAANPHLQVIVLAGNHDSAHRLQAPREILSGMNVHVVGTPRRPDGSLWLSRLVVPLRNRAGEVAGCCAAVPFLRPSDLEATEDAADPLVEGVRRLYDEVLCHARERTPTDGFLLAMGHCYMVGTALSELSERRILGGNQHALPVDLFPDDVDYVALGHLHKAQRVGPREHVRYSGAPLPLSMGEAAYRHEVRVIEFEGGELVQSYPVRVPRAVDLVRVPAQGAAPIEEVLDRLAALPAVEDFEDPETRPYLEVRVRLDAPVPDVRARVEAGLAGRGPRLLKLTLEHPVEHRSLGEARPHTTLAELEPEHVLRSLYASRHGGEVPDAVLRAFHELVEEVAP